MMRHYNIELFKVPLEGCFGEEWFTLRNFFAFFNTVDKNKSTVKILSKLKNFQLERDPTLRILTNWRCRGETLLEYALKLSRYDLASELLIMGIPAEITPLKIEDESLKELEAKLSFALMRKKYIESESLDADDWIRLGSDEFILTLVYQAVCSDIIAQQILGELCFNQYAKFTKDKKLVPNWNKEKNEANKLSSEESDITRKETIRLFTNSSNKYPRNIRFIEAQMEAIAEISGGVSGEIHDSENSLDASFKAIDILKQKRKHEREKINTVTAMFEIQQMSKEDKKATNTSFHIEQTSSLLFREQLPATTQLAKRIVPAISLSPTTTIHRPKPATHEYSVKRLSI